MIPRLRPLPVLLTLLLAGTARADDEPRLQRLAPTSVPLASQSTAALPTASFALASPDLASPAPASPAPAAPAPAPTASATPGTGAVPAPVALAISSSLPGQAAPATAAELMKKDAQVAAQVTEPSPTPAATAALAQSVRQGEDVFARIRRGLGSNVCAAGESSERWRRRYASNPRAFANRIEQILPLLDFVSVEVERVGLPSEFTFIPLVESWYKPEAMGAGGPAGMWQMIGSTARNHGIHIKDGYDGRLSPVESTRAALSYLKVLHNMFGGWEATVMAYNAGEGRMMQAYKRARSREASGDRRRPHGLSNITYDYVAKLQALSCLVSQPERNNLSLPRASRFVPLAPVLMEPDVSSLDQFANRQGRNVSDLRWLNPGYREGRVVAGVPRLVLMPLGVQQSETSVHVPTPDSARAAVLATALPVLQAPVIQAIEAPVAVDTSLVTTAARMPDPAPLLAPAPAPSTGMVVADADVAPIEPLAAMQAAAQPAASPTHHVVAGESLWTIARLHQVDMDQLRQWNHLDRRAVVHPGQMLTLAP